MDGRIRLAFRSLSPAENDACFKAVDNLQTEMDTIFAPHEILERLLRYRMTLQLVLFETDCGSLNARLEEFPESLDDWDIKENGNQLSPDKKVPIVEEQLHKEYFRNTFMLTSFGKKLSEFNRLISKLEDNVDSPDFWKVEQSR